MNLFINLPKPNQIKSWFLITIIIKGLFFCFFLFFFSKYFSEKNKQQLVYNIVVYGHDTDGYIEIAENFFNGNGYVYNGKLSAWRMPGIAFVYGPIYYFFGREVASVSFVIIQFLLSVFSVYYVAKIAYILSSKTSVFYITYILYLISTYVSIYDHFLLTESMSASIVVFSLYHFLLYFKHLKIINLVFSALLLSLGIMFRPAVSFIAIAYILFYIYYIYRMNIFDFMMVKKLLVFCAITFSLLSIWNIRNLIYLNSFIPFVDHSESVSETEVAVLNFVKSQGENLYAHDGVKGKYFHWYLPNFQSFDGLNHYYDSTFSETYQIPEKYLTPDYSLDSLKLLREYCWAVLNPNSNLPDKIRNFYKQEVLRMTERFSTSYAKHYPLDYYIFNKLNWIKEMLFITKSYALPTIGQTFFEKSIRRIYVVLYYIILCGGLAYSLDKMILNNNEVITLLVSFVIFVFIFIHIVLGFIENRYIVPIYPLLCIQTSLFIDRFLKHKTKYNLNVSS